MELKVTPSFFYGAGAAAALGLGLGALLHGPWGAFGGARAPQILFPSAQAAEAPKPPRDGAAETAQAGKGEADPGALYAGYLPPDPQPVVRLAADRFDAMQAAADAAKRVDTATALREAGVDLPAAPASPPPGEGALQGQMDALKADATPAM